MLQKYCFFKSTIGRKQLVALTGLILSLFVLTHMAGNLLILVSPQKYNEYAHSLVSNPFLELIEWVLLFALVSHFIIAMKLQINNFKAKPQAYARSGQGKKGTDPVSQTMAIQGLLILVFIVLHLITFKYGTSYEVNYGTGPMRDLHRLVVEVFHNPIYVGWYLVALVVLGLHLKHGVKSLFQTLGFNHPKYQCALQVFALLYAIVVSCGFIIQPIYVYFIFQN
ncbi:MAG: succinate dehydrogenase cytochrome b subunit [Bdellovibrionales bacterium]|nr:succinate dehydrogenase cytochrome b subunit [Bdellovibrionales bacterium]